LRIALMYFIWTHIGGALFLAGILFYGVNAGTFDILIVKQWALEYNNVYAGVKVEGLAMIAPLLIILGLLVKMAVFGVHMWLPYAHAEAPTPVSALLSPNLIGIAGYALARFGLTLFPGFMDLVKHYLVLIAFITIVYGGLVALRQDDFKRFLAYSSISQMGYILLGVSTLTTFGIAGAMLHYLSHAVGKAVLFMIAGVFIAEIRGLRSMSAMGGLARLYPVTAAMALIGFMHLVGVPPAFGMWSELLILLGLSGAYYPGSLYEISLIAVAVIASFIVTAFYSFIAMRRIFFGKPRRESPLEVMDEFKVSILVIALAGIILFLVVGLMLPQLRDSSLELLALGGLR
ncbi:MAG: NuoM family protein, partial [Acidilobaceae archaeon]